MPLSSHPYLPTCALAFGAFPTLVGLQLLLVDPLSGLSMLGYTVPTDPSSRQLSTSLMRFFGARDLTLGLVTLAVWRFGNRKTLGVTTGLGTGLAVMDGLINQVDVVGGGWKHWVFVPFGAMLSGGLLGVFDGLL
ncbi:hypothetical protein PMZ80_009826 [Knufia obscura]|uniref:Uncharacterized protein n=2 Tax=Knufia TaxID=430999 RepID=A0AAN8EHG0_9EURO|nr:hypothetical protein PMZ80_009826 [Knufia obscura]KAK5955919.1 hypothetical protein OHC33_002492 [Knufia fluminis]